MTKEEFYQQSDICRQANNTEKIGKTDVLYCPKNKNACTLKTCPMVEK